MKKQAGFTLIELVMVIVILGILGAIAVPRFVDLSDDAEAAAARGMSGAVKAAHAIAIADLKGFPTVAQLVGYVQAEGVAEATTGITVSINGQNCIIPTFSNSNCGSPNNSTTREVQCVGSISDLSGCTSP